MLSYNLVIWEGAPRDLLTCVSRASLLCGGVSEKSLPFLLQPQTSQCKEPMNAN